MSWPSLSVGGGHVGAQFRARVLLGLPAGVEAPHQLCDSVGCYDCRGSAPRAAGSSDRRRNFAVTPKLFRAAR